ncbi:DUF983 domain-containing protein [Flavobacteriales bacterium]|nr:DUF983 domain-containing protein [Flavobacteriales bacterium]
MRKGTKLYSILKRKCPHCHEGDFFTGYLYNLKHLVDIHETCSVCNETYTFGALYISYTLGTAVVVTIWLALIIIGAEIEIIPKITGISVVWILISPLMHFLSKIIWANIFMNYKLIK